MGFGKEIKRLRELNNLSGRQMAEIIGVDKDRLKQWELKDFEPRAEDRNTIEKFLGYPLEMLPKYTKFPDKVQKKIEAYLSGTSTTKVTSIQPTNIRTSTPSYELIPFYDDVASVGGTQVVANMHGVTTPTEWIDAGDWFREATSAIRHYGDSMDEYKSGCILALKEVQDIELLVWGKNYVIETSEYRITKKVGKGKEGYIKAHSTNQNKYDDGSLIHQPIDVPMKKITKISLVLGMVQKESSSTSVKLK